MRARAFRWVVVVVLAGVLRQAGGQTRSKFEPERGCYLGAFIEKDKVARGDYRKFEQLTGKKHASYFTYVGYGMPFPSEWVARVRAAGAAPHLAFEPNDGLKAVRDDEYLREWARAARAAACPIFLRFASEMNGDWTAYHDDPRQYVEKFRLVHRVMAEEAPNVAMVWTPFASLRENSAHYYPGDAYVDWVGVNIYSVYIHDGNPARLAAQEDPGDFLRVIYRRYADRKPIHISEFAAAHYHKALNRTVVDFAIEKMRRFYESLRREFPRVKSINWFCMDTVEEKLADSNYCLLDDARKLATYQRLVSDDYFLSHVETPPLVVAIAPKPPVPPRPQPATSASERERDVDRALSNRGAIIVDVGGVTLRGIENGRSYPDSAQLVAIVPPTLRARLIIFELDGGAHTRITNRAPYYYFIESARVGLGAHSVRVTIKTADDRELISEPLKFTLTPPRE